MSLPASSVPNWQTKPPGSDGLTPTLSWDSVQTVARYWAGAGSFLDWLVPAEWEVDVKWGIEQTRARVAEIVLYGFQTGAARYLPANAGEWLDILSQQLRRSVNRVEAPTEHTDWSATLSEFGAYPSPLYIDRRPVGSFDTPFTRVLLWTAQAVTRAEGLVFGQFGRRPLMPNTRTRLVEAAALPEVNAATIGFRPDWADLDVCRSSGGAWLILSRLAEQLTALWFGNPVEQFKTLRPILPEFGPRLFDLAALGTVVDACRGTANERWITRNPIAAATRGEPCFQLLADDFSLEIYYQTVPRSGDDASIYRRATRKVGGGSLRPDIWVRLLRDETCINVICECKFSLASGEVSSGVSQLMAYSLEYPRPSDANVHFAVGPVDVIREPASADQEFVVGCDRHLATLIKSMLHGSHAQVLTDWEA